MKKIWIPALALVLSSCLLTACRDRNHPAETVVPTAAPSSAPTAMPTVPPATQTTRPTAAETMPSETADRGNGPLETVTDPTVRKDGALDQSRSRNRTPAGN